MIEYEKLSDLDLIALCLKSGSRDERPFFELFQRQAPFINRVLWRYFPSEQDVEDLAQEVFFKIYRSLNQFESRSSLKTWIFTITINTAKNELRKRNRRLNVVDQISLDPDSLVAEKLDQSLIEDINLQQVLEQLVEGLTEAEREILTLKDKLDLTYLEIADQLDISESAAKMRVQRSRLALKKKYLEMMDEN